MEAVTDLPEKQAQVNGGDLLLEWHCDDYGVILAGIDIYTGALQLAHHLWAPLVSFQPLFLAPSADGQLNLAREERPLANELKPLSGILHS